MTTILKLTSFHSLAAAVLVGCNPSTDLTDKTTPTPGSQCTVQFRRDVLGVAANAVVSPRTDVFNGSETAVRGTLKLVTKDWLVLDSRNEELWIPKNLILLVRARPE